ncbi:MAG: hypothetical protein UV54_C0024G0009 [Candidatus Beckwithbacteria bacterium GW2011_GWA2_43_10]|uniref:Camelysin metallo-endopeptidase n=1 Tax=Candidatus Beckwithbacteria bacterium GW2011_GWA2_43_10 TaxID=1618369 RepID=A0A0G1C2M6_9BACT|nr:MAG: hypothetical protein UV54_C0024G0009 [Candidatus Beckwithbacteria bacterium GW2011_GWA2_43_10]
MNITDKKRLLVSLLVVTVVGVGAGAATAAFLTARRTTSVNRFEQGTLDLDVASAGVAVEPFVIENIGEFGDISGTKEWTITNTGTLPGRLLVRIKNLQNNENGCNDQEKETEPGCALDNIGELGGVINLKLSLNGTDAVSSFLADADQGNIGTAWKALPTITLQPNDTVTVGAHWATGEADYGNEVQSDDLTFDMDFRLIQQITGDIEN